MIGKLLAAVAMLATLTLGANWYYLDGPAAKVLARDQHNADIVMRAYAKWLIDPRYLVLDLWSIDSDNSMLDVDRIIFQISSSLRDHSFETVTLAFRGRSRFILDGNYFAELGSEFDAGRNPVSLIRTLPGNVKNPDGSHAFPTWSGRLLGVASQQMEDHNEFHRRWYANDMIEIMGSKQGG